MFFTDRQELNSKLTMKGYLTENKSVQTVTAARQSFAQRYVPLNISS